jgi:hypothetical protein
MQGGAAGVMAGSHSGWRDIALHVFMRQVLTLTLFALPLPNALLPAAGERHWANFSGHAGSC